MKRDAKIIWGSDIKTKDKVIFKRAGDEIAVWYYHQNGTITKSGEEIEGSIKCIFTENFGKKKAAKIEYIKNRIKDGAYKWYDSKNKLLKEEITYSDDFKHGPYKMYFPSGKVKMEGEYENDRINGVVKEYYEEGGLKGTWIHKDFELKEVYQYYPDEIILKEEWKYNRGKLNGLAREYYRSRVISAEVPYKNGNIHGTVKEYYENRVVKEVARFINGKEKSSKVYDENGKLIK